MSPAMSMNSSKAARNKEECFVFGLRASGSLCSFCTKTRGLHGGRWEVLCLIPILWVQRKEGGKEGRKEGRLAGGSRSPFLLIWGLMGRGGRGEFLLQVDTACGGLSSICKDGVSDRTLGRWGLAPA